MTEIPTPEQLVTLNPTDHITSDYRDELRRLGRASLFFFAKYLFGRTGLNERAHRPLCDFAQSIIVRPNAFGVCEDPRGTGKSHSITIPGVAWCLIQNEEEMTRRGLLPLGPSANVIVASYKTPFAAVFLDITRREMETNTIFQWLYGDILPENRGAKGATWSKEFFTVARERGSGYSAMALGTESGSTSLHPLVLFIDDLVNEINFKSSTEVQSQVEWVEHSHNLVEITRGSRIVTQNAWSERDVNFALRDKNKKNPRSIAFFSRSRMVCDLCEGGRPLDDAGNPVPCGSGFEHPLSVRPILDHYVKEPYGPYTRDDVERLRAELPSAIWFAQHENNPLARAELKWREEWIRFYTIENDAAVLVTGVGGVSGGPKGCGRPDPDRLTRVPIRDMHVIVGLDPGLHRPGIAATGRARVPGVGETLFILDCSTEALSPRDQFFLMFDWVLKWGARGLAFENVGLQAYIRQTIPTMAEAYEKERGRTLPHWVRRPNPDAKRIVGVRVYQREGDKVTRTDATLSPFAEQRLIACRRDIRAFLDEYIIFDKGKYIDGLESVAMTVKAWTVGRPATVEDLHRASVAARDEAETYERAHVGAIGYGEGV